MLVREFKEVDQSLGSRPGGRVVYTNLRGATSTNRNIHIQKDIASILYI